MKVVAFDNDSITDDILHSSLAFSKNEFRKVINETNPHLVLPTEASLSPESLEKWSTNLKCRAGRIYLCYYQPASVDPSSDTSAIPTAADQLAGLVFTYKKQETKSTHVWLVITGKEYRRLGVMKKLFQEMELFEAANADIQDKDQRYLDLTVNTIPLKFPSMPLALESLGFTLVATRPIEGGLELYSFKKSL